MKAKKFYQWVCCVALAASCLGASAGEGETDHYMGMTPDQYFGLLLSSSEPSPYAANPETPLDLLIGEARKVCHIPGKVSPLAEEYLMRYVGQAVYSEWRMSGVDFVQGFNHEDQSFEYQSYCIVAFMNRPWDRNTEVVSKIIEAARQGGTLPDRMVAGFNRAGDWQFEPLNR
ncbi:MAG: hypothetical protein H6624_11620 [Bdellovibrionaceae bacterium]|nr:hypothetical protein [Bdellovibrionales bacterium]MCB9084988.1 hypothetical protein [Pseudobdellovibrionaceae bacterium]